MASVFKRGKKYLASFRKADGAWTSRVAGSDKGEAERLAAFWEGEAKLRREGLIDPRADAYKAANDAKLAEHIDGYEADLIAKGRTAKHAELTAGRVRLLLASVDGIGDIRPAAVNSALKQLKDSRGLSMQSASHYLRAAKLFSRWLWKDGRTREDALAGLSVKTSIAKADRVRQRRALSRDEFAALLRHVANAPKRYGMAPADRVMIYRVACGTGLRASELASLTPEDFALKGGEPAVTVAAGYSKRGKRSGRDDLQPLPMDLANDLAAWLKGRAKGKPAFTLPEYHRTGEMLRADLQSARAGWIRETSDRNARRERRDSDFLAFRDASDRVIDFHALRHTYISWLCGSGASVSVCQALARHSTPVLTLNTYSHPTLADHRAALEGLPTMAPATKAPERASMKKTGTDDARALPDAVSHFPRAVNAHKTDVISGLRMAQYGTSEVAGAGERETLQNKAFCDISRGKSQLQPAGIEPATGGLEIRCSIQLSYGCAPRIAPVNIPATGSTCQSSRS
jgi:integrase